MADTGSLKSQQKRKYLFLAFRTAVELLRETQVKSEGIKEEKDMMDVYPVGKGEKDVAREINEYMNLSGLDDKDKDKTLYDLVESFRSPYTHENRLATFETFSWKSDTPVKQLKPLIELLRKKVIIHPYIRIYGGAFMSATNKVLGEHIQNAARFLPCDWEDASDSNTDNEYRPLPITNLGGRPRTSGGRLISDVSGMAKRKGESDDAGRPAKMTKEKPSEGQ